MFATASTIEYPATAAGQQGTSCAQRMSTRSARAMCSREASANILFIQTGVIASVSLFVLLIIVGNFLLAGLLILPGLLGLLSLSGLTRLIAGLVGLVKGLSPGTNTGD